MSPDQARHRNQVLRSASRAVALCAVLRAIADTGALQAATLHATNEARMARAALDALRDSKYKQSLLDLATFAVERTH